VGLPSSRWRESNARVHVVQPPAYAAVGLLHY
jgi:hypothetical protein